MKKYAIGMIALVTIGLLGVGFVTAFPMGFRGFKELTEEEMNKIQERRQIMREAIENKDFEAWRTLMEERIEEMRAGLTQENFEKIAEMHQERREACQNGGSDGCGCRLRPRGRFFGNNPLRE